MRRTAIVGNYGAGKADADATTDGCARPAPTIEKPWSDRVSMRPARSCSSIYRDHSSCDGLSPEPCAGLSPVRPQRDTFLVKASADAPRKLHSAGPASSDQIRSGQTAGSFSLRFRPALASRVGRSLSTGARVGRSHGLLRKRRGRRSRRSPSGPNPSLVGLRGESALGHRPV